MGIFSEPQLAVVPVHAARLALRVVQDRLVNAGRVDADAIMGAPKLARTPDLREGFVDAGGGAIFPLTLTVVLQRRGTANGGL